MNYYEMKKMATIRISKLLSSNVDKKKIVVDILTSYGFSKRTTLDIIETIEESVPSEVKV